MHWICIAASRSPAPLVQPFLTKTHRRIDVRVSAGPREVARWTFSLDSDAGDGQQWREALIRPINRGSTLDISFAIDAPTSPFAEGISGDQRILGLGLRKLIFRSFHDQSRGLLSHRFTSYRREGASPQ
jgi:hypothetical protein